MDKPTNDGNGVSIVIPGVGTTAIRATRLGRRSCLTPTRDVNGSVLLDETGTSMLTVFLGAPHYDRVVDAARALLAAGDQDAADDARYELRTALIVLDTFAKEIHDGTAR